MKSGIITWV
jgi:WD40 repeat protein